MLTSPHALKGLFIMKINLKQRYLWAKDLIAVVTAGRLMAGILFLSGFEIQNIEAEPLLSQDQGNNLVIVQENSITPLLGNVLPDKNLVTRRIPMVITAYSSSIWETDDTPFITASGSTVRDGIVANNLLPFGTKVRIPDLYGNKVFVVEDRMNSRVGYHHLDIWFPERYQALEFGAKTGHIEVLKN